MPRQAVPLTVRTLTTVWLLFCRHQAHCTKPIEALFPWHMVPLCALHVAIAHAPHCFSETSLGFLERLCYGATLQSVLLFLMWLLLRPIDEGALWIVAAHDAICFAWYMRERCCKHATWTRACLWLSASVGTPALVYANGLACQMPVDTFVRATLLALFFTELSGTVREAVLPK